jgi:hypothetical protein
MKSFKPTVLIDMLTFRKIMYWTYKASEEVSGLGTVTYDSKEGAFRVHSAMLLPQLNGPTSTDIDEKAVQKAMFELRDAPGSMRFWWHSHVNMGTFWSGTDHDTIKQIGDHGWVLAMVVNKKNELRSAFYGGKAMMGEFPLFIDELTTNLEYGAACEQAWADEFKLNVTDVMAKAEEEKRAKWFTNSPQTPAALSSTGSPAAPLMQGWERDAESGQWFHPEKKPKPTKSTGSSGRKLGEIPSDTSSKHGEQSSDAVKLEAMDKTQLEEALSKNEKPAWCGKRAWRRARKVWVQIQEERAGKEYKGLSDRWTGEPIDEEDFVQPYPFTQEELEAMAHQGFDTTSIDMLIANGWQRDGIWKYAFDEIDIYGNVTNYGREMQRVGK